MWVLDLLAESGTERLMAFDESSLSAAQQYNFRMGKIIEQGRLSTRKLAAQFSLHLAADAN
jgi:hypothetical protein